MPRKSRKSIVTPFFHVIAQGINKKYIFENQDEIKYYLKIMNKIKEKYNVKIIAYCIMNNHVHMLLNVNNTQNLSKYMQSLNTQYAKFYNKKYDRVGYVFRDRYKSEGINTQKHLYNCISYIYNNPVKAGICKKPEEYPYSNYKENKFYMQERNEDYKFIDVEDERKSTKEIINECTERVNLNDKEQLKNVIYYLNKEKGISFRKIEKQIGIGRETLRKLIK